MKHAVDLVRLIKRKRPHTSLAVAGYPEVHPDAESSELDIKYLKEKVVAGADFIITQICFQSTAITHFTAQCREIGIQIPIVPGIFIPFSYNSLLSMCRICKVMVPEEDFKAYKNLKDDTDAFRNFAVQATVKILNNLFQNDADSIIGVHFFTLNKFELIKRVVEILGFE